MFAVNKFRQFLNGQTAEISPADSHVLKAQAFPQSPDSLDLELKDGSSKATRRRNDDPETGYGEDSSDPIAAKQECGTHSSAKREVAVQHAQKKPSANLRSQPGTASKRFTSTTSFIQAQHPSYTSRPYEPKQVDSETGRPLKKQKTVKVTHVSLLDDQEEISDDAKVDQSKPHATPPPSSFDNGDGTPSRAARSLVPEYSETNDLVEIPRNMLSKQTRTVRYSDDEVLLNNSDDELTCDVQEQRTTQASRNKPSDLTKHVKATVTEGPTSKYFSPESKGLSDQFIPTNGLKRSTNMGNDSSPDVLHGPETTVRRNNNKATKPQTAKPKTESRFSLQSIICGDFPQDYQELTATINPGNQQLSIKGSTLLNDSPFITLSLRKAVKGCYEPDQTIVSLVFSKEGQAPNKIFLNFESKKQASDFTVLVQDISGFYLQHKDGDWMRRAWQKQLGEHEHYQSSIEHASAKVKALSEKMECVEVPKTNTGQTKRQSRPIVSKLRGSPVPLSSPTPATRRSQTQRHQLGNNSEREQIAVDVSTPGTSNRNKIPVKTYATRSGGNKAPTIIDDDDGEMQRPKPMRKVDLGPPWKKPFVYPQSGKNRAEVEFQDLERLQDHEMLNDNLIGFYLRYLQSYLEETRPDLAEKVYFFNTYFFATLTSSGKGRRGINYEGVQKWTRRGVDIFTKKFIVVPINEATHWYVALICNLPALKREIGLEDDEKEHQAVDEADVSLETTREEDRTDTTIPNDSQLEDLPEVMDIDQQNESNRQAVNGMSLDSPGPATKLSARDDTSNPNDTPTSATKKVGSANKRKLGRSLQKYDPDEPIIITLDSLAMGRSPTIRMLREYVVAEAMEKRAMVVDGASIKGMSAKGIPFQNNFSDCGLFLLAYVEKFVLDPYRFVHDILQREMNVDDHWPEMESSDLRNRLRSFIINLRKTQPNISDSNTLAPVGKILLGPPRSPPPAPAELSRPSSRPKNDTIDVERLGHQRDARAPTPLNESPAKKTQLSSPSGRPSPRDGSRGQQVKPLKQNLQAGKVRHGLIVLDDDVPTKRAQDSRSIVDPNFLVQLEDAAREPDEIVILKSPGRASRASSINTDFMINSRNNEPILNHDGDTANPLPNTIDDEIRVEPPSATKKPIIEDAIVVDTQSPTRSRQRHTVKQSHAQETQTEEEIPETPIDEDEDDDHDQFAGADVILDQGESTIALQPSPHNNNDGDIEAHNREKGNDNNEMLDV
ncbi:MAG: hypothetical protein Q9160_001512 [Pyrenula sp. 1 TL-2023]